MDGDTPFSILMQQAAALRTSRQAPLRKKYDSWPRWYQSSLFSKDDVICVRSLKFEQKLTFASDCKVQGNNFYLNDDIYEAMNAYERALAVFSWAEPTDPDWKKKVFLANILRFRKLHRNCCKDIDDETIVQCKHECASEDEDQSIRNLTLVCILNLAACYQRTQDWGDCIRACDAVLAIDPNCTKAFYRRAQARYLPASCTIQEHEVALEDLEQALKLSPDDKNIIQACESLRKSIKDQRASEKVYSKKALKGDGKRKGKKGSKVVEDAPSAPSGSPPPAPPRASTSSSSSSNSAPSSSSSSSSSRKHGMKHQSTEAAEDRDLTSKTTMSIKDAQVRIKDIQSSAARLERSGRIAEARQLNEKAALIQKEIDTFVEVNAVKRRIAKLKQQQDWLEQMAASEFVNSSPEIIQEASTRGLDLMDTRAQRLMAEMCKEMLVSKRDKRLMLMEALDKFNTGEISSLPKPPPPRAGQRDDDEREDESMSEVFLTRVMTKVRRREAQEISAKIVAGLSAHGLRSMVSSRLVYGNGPTAVADASLSANAPPVGSFTQITEGHADGEAVSTVNAHGNRPSLEGQASSSLSTSSSRVSANEAATSPSPESPSATPLSASHSSVVPAAAPQDLAKKYMAIGEQIAADADATEALAHLATLDAQTSPIDELSKALVAVMVEDILELERDTALNVITPKEAPIAPRGKIGENLGSTMIGMTPPDEVIKSEIPGETHGDKVYNMLLQKYGGCTELQIGDYISGLISIFCLIVALSFMAARLFIGPPFDFNTTDTNSAYASNYQNHQYSAGRMSGYGAAPGGAAGSADLMGAPRGDDFGL